MQIALQNALRGARHFAWPSLYPLLLQSVPRRSGGAPTRVAASFRPPAPPYLGSLVPGSLAQPVAVAPQSRVRGEGPGGSARPARSRGCRAGAGFAGYPSDVLRGARRLPKRFAANDAPSKAFFKMFCTTVWRFSKVSKVFSKRFQRVF